ncbi:hypothetical protein SELMODRAFT_16651, partial [Selaginella moellendorffii]
TAMLNAYARAGRIGKAKKIFDELPHRDLVSWTSMLTAYARCGYVDQAREIFDQMPAIFNRIKLLNHCDDVCFLSILIASSHDGELYTARSHFVSMSMDFQLQPTKQHYTCLVDLLARAGHLNEARELMLTMPYLTDSVDWKCFLGACRSHSDLRRGGHAAKRTLEMDSNNGSAYSLLANIYSMR